MAAPTTAAQPTPPAVLRDGMTFELGLGYGVLHRTGADGYGTFNSVPSPSLDIGVGGWLTSRLALTGRLASMGVVTSDTVVGPSVQYWMSDHVWVGAGGGLEVLTQLLGGGGALDVAFDLRSGYMLGSSNEHTFNVSLELSSHAFSAFSDSAQVANVTKIALLVGYQHL